MKSIKRITSFITALFSAMLLFSFVACANGSSDDGNPEPTPQPAPAPQPTATETNGTVSADSIIIADDTAKITVDENSYYLFTEKSTEKNNDTRSRTAATTVDTTKGGTWKFYKNNKLVYSGTYKGDISELANIVDSNSSSSETSTGLSLELTVTAVADEDGDLYEITTDAEAATFTFEIKPSDEEDSFVFEATIPEVTVSETPAFTGINVGDGPYFVKCGDYYFFSGVDGKYIDQVKAYSEEIGKKIEFTVDGYNINLTLESLETIMEMVQIDYIIIYKKGVQTAFNTYEFEEFKKELSEDTHYIVKDNIFVILTDAGYLTAKTKGLLPDYGSVTSDSTEQLITTESVENGIKVIVEIPEGFDKVTILRKYHNNDFRPWYQQTVTEGTTFITAIDYFVEENASYAYKAVYESTKDGSKHKEANIETVKSTVNGLEPPFISNTAEGYFSEGSKRIIFTTEPVITVLDNFTSVVGNFTPSSYSLYFKDNDSYNYYDFPFDLNTKQSVVFPDDYLTKTFTFEFMQVEFCNTSEPSAKYIFEITQNIQIPKFTFNRFEVDSTKNTGTINYKNTEETPHRGFITINTSKLDGIAHIKNTIKPLNTSNNNFVVTNGIMGYIFNVKEENSSFSFSIAGVRYNQKQNKAEAYVETYKNISAQGLEQSLTGGSHATSTNNQWNQNDFGFELADKPNVTSGALDIWIDVVANDGETNGRKGAAGTYTVNFYSADPGRTDGTNYAITYQNSSVQPLATLTVETADVSNPYSTSLIQMKAPIGCYASVQPYQTLTGTWEF